MKRHLPHLASFSFSACLVTMLSPGIYAQAQPERPPTSSSPAQFDPADVYFQGYLLAQNAEKLTAEKKSSESLEKYQQAQQLFELIHRDFPDWRKSMVQARLSTNQAAIDRLAPAALEAAASSMEEKASECEARSDEALALAWYEKSLKRYELLQNQYPDWNKDNTRDRIAKTRKTIERLRPAE